MTQAPVHKCVLNAIKVLQKTSSSKPDDIVNLALIMLDVNPPQGIKVWTKDIILEVLDHLVNTKRVKIIQGAFGVGTIPMYAIHEDQEVLKATALKFLEEEIKSNQESIDKEEEQEGIEVDTTGYKKNIKELNWLVEYVKNNGIEFRPAEPEDGRQLEDYISGAQMVSFEKPIPVGMAEYAIHLFATEGF